MACRTNEALAAGEAKVEEEARAARVAEALTCPCVADLKHGPCGTSFVTAFSCFHLSTSEPRGCDCLAANLAFAACLRSNPDAIGPDPAGDGAVMGKSSGGGTGSKA